MEILKSQDGLTTKYIHDDLSETAIKTVGSQEQIINPNTGKLDYIQVERNKYSLFVSSSSGCAMNCKFCHLTIKEMPFNKLSEDQVLQNMKDALESRIEIEPSLKDRYIKICWMGMGEQQILKAPMTARVTMEFLEWVFENGYAKGLDGVDISTVLPKNVNHRWIDIFSQLNENLKEFKINPYNKLIVSDQGKTLPGKYKNRTPLRVFYSLHSTKQTVREDLIPNAEEIPTAIERMKMLDEKGVNVIYHYMFLDGVNDDYRSVGLLEKFWKDYDLDKHELRILRYNEAENDPYQESTNIDSIIEKLRKNLKHVKTQVSFGKDVKAACGQFIASENNWYER